MAIKAVSFDFWNTLFAETPGSFKLYQQTRRRLLKEALNAQDGNFTDEQIERAALLEAESHQIGRASCRDRV